MYKKRSRLLRITTQIQNNNSPRLANALRLLKLGHQKKAPFEQAPVTSEKFGSEMANYTRQINLLFERVSSTSKRVPKAEVSAVALPAQSFLQEMVTLFQTTPALPQNIEDTIHSLGRFKDLHSKIVVSESEEKDASQYNFDGIIALLAGMEDKDRGALFFDIIRSVPNCTQKKKMIVNAFWESCKPFIDNCMNIGSLHPLILLWRNAPDMTDPRLIGMIAKAFAFVDRGFADSLIDVIQNKVERAAAKTDLDAFTAKDNEDVLSLKQEGIVLFSNFKRFCALAARLGDKEAREMLSFQVGIVKAYS